MAIQTQTLRPPDIGKEVVPFGFEPRRFIVWPWLRFTCFSKQAVNQNNAAWRMSSLLSKVIVFDWPLNTHRKGETGH